MRDVAMYEKSIGESAKTGTNESRLRTGATTGSVTT